MCGVSTRLESYTCALGNLPVSSFFVSSFACGLPLDSLLHNQVSKCSLAMGCAILLVSGNCSPPLHRLSSSSRALSLAAKCISLSRRWSSQRARPASQWKLVVYSTSWSPTYCLRNLPYCACSDHHSEMTVGLYTLLSHLPQWFVLLHQSLSICVYKVLQCFCCISDWASCVIPMLHHRRVHCIRHFTCFTHRIGRLHHCCFIFIVVLYHFCWAPLTLCLHHTCIPS